jgi:hypothetical protein
MVTEGRRAAALFFSSALRNAAGPMVGAALGRVVKTLCGLCSDADTVPEPSTALDRRRR